MPRTVPALAVTALLLLAPAGRGAGPADRGEDPAVEAARARRQAVRTADVRFQRTDVFRRGGASDGRPADVPVASKGEVPGRDLTFEAAGRLVLDGDKARLEDNRPAWHPNVGRVDELSSVSVFDGAATKTLWPRGAANEGKPLGGVQRAGRLDLAQLPDVSPLTFAFRGLDPALVPTPLDWFTPTGAAQEVAGMACREYAVTHGPFALSLWLAPGERYVVRRARLTQKGRPVYELEVAYRPDEAAGPVPDSWVLREYNQFGALSDTTTVQVVQVRINEPVAAEEFDLTFPQQALVGDQDDKTWYRVQPDGALREEELAAGPPWYRRPPWILAVTGVLLAAGPLAYALLRRARRRAPAG
jgi:hypothetical protein